MVVLIGAKSQDVATNRAPAATRKTHHIQPSCSDFIGFWVIGDGVLQRAMAAAGDREWHGG